MQKYTPSLVMQIEIVQLVSPSSPTLIPTIKIGLGKPYTKMEVGTGLELDDAYWELAVMTMMRWESQWSHRSVRQQVSTEDLFICTQILYSNLIVKTLPQSSGKRGGVSPHINQVKYCRLSARYFEGRGWFQVLVRPTYNDIIKQGFWLFCDLGRRIKSNFCIEEIGLWLTKTDTQPEGEQPSL